MFLKFNFQKKEWWRCSQWHWQYATGSDWGIGCHVGGRTRLGRVILSRFTKESGMNKNYDVIRVIYSMNFDSLFIFQVQILWTVFIYYHLLYSFKTWLHLHQLSSLISLDISCSWFQVADHHYYWRRCEFHQRISLWKVNLFILVLFRWRNFNVILWF